MKKNLLIILFLSFCIEGIRGQSVKNITHQNILWYVYINTLELNEKWQFLTDIQERHFIEPFAQHQFLFRTQANYKLGAEWKSSVGMCLFYQSPNEPISTSQLIVPELRPHIEFTNRQKLKWAVLSHRYRVEARYFHNTMNDKLVKGYTFGNFRFRYQIGLSIPVLKQTETNTELLSLKLQDEILLNAGKKILRNVFDQNRYYIGLNYRLFKNLNIEIGYLNWFQERTNGNDFYLRNIFRFTVYHFITLSKKS